MKQIITMQCKVDVSDEDGKNIRSITKEMACAATAFMARTLPGSKFMEYKVQVESEQSKPKPKKEEQLEEEG